MECRKYELYIVALALDEREGLSKTAIAQTEAHLRECAACRKAYEGTRRLASLLAPESEDVRLMASAADTTRLMAAIDRQAAHQRMLRLTRIAAAVLVGIGVVGLVVVGVRTLSRQAGQQAPVAQGNAQEAPAPEPIARAPELPPAPKLSALEESFLAAKTPGEALQALQAAFDAEKARKDGPSDNLPIIIALCDRLKEKWPITSEAYRSMQLASRCWTQLGEVQKAQDVYVAYAEYEGELEKQLLLRDGKSSDQAEARKTKIISRDLLIEAEGLFQAREYVQSLSFCDLLMTRYPAQEEGLEAMRLVGMYSFEQRQYDEAIRTFKQVIEIGPDSHAAFLARTTLPLALTKAGRRGEAAQMWLAYVQKAKTQKEAARYTYQAGVTLTRGNEEERAQAPAVLQKVISEYPDQKQWVTRAEGSLAALRTRPVQKELKGVGNPLDILER